MSFTHLLTKPQDNGKAVEELFAEALKLCAKAGLVKVGLVEVA